MQSSYTGAYRFGRSILRDRREQARGGNGHAGDGRQSQKWRASVREVKPYAIHARSGCAEFEVLRGLPASHSMVQFRES